MNYYPPVGFYFVVVFRDGGAASISGQLKMLLSDSNFKEVSGLTSELGIDKYQEGGVNDYQHPLPKPAHFNNITLKRGMLTNSGIVDWMRNALEDFIIVPKAFTIVLLGPEGFPVAAWDVTGAYPVKWEISGFNAMDNSIVVESIEFVCQKHRRLPI